MLPIIKKDERYLCGYLCNKLKFNDLCILLNFYSEIANISKKTTTVDFMQIRLKWYIDAILNLYKGVKSGYKLLDDLDIIIKKYNILQEDIILIVESRNIDKDYNPFNNINSFYDYCRNTGGKIWQLVSKIYGYNLKEEKAALYAGTAFALIGIIRNYNFDSRRMHYPLIFNKKNVINTEFYNKELNKNVKSVIELAQKELLKSKKIKEKGKKKLLLLLNIFTSGYISNIKRNDYNIKTINPFYISIKYKICILFKYISFFI